MVRIPIREQLALLMLLCSMIGLAVVSIGTWVTTRNFVLKLRQNRLMYTASLKASILESDLSLMQNSVQFCANRIVIQNALQVYNDDGNNTLEHWSGSQVDMTAALNSFPGSAVGQSLLLQSRIFPADATGPAGSSPLLNTTSQDVIGRIKLPYSNPDGTDVYLGDDGLGYPPQLYPNITYGTIAYNGTYNVSTAIYDGNILTPPADTWVIGPWPINSTFALVSMTIPIINNTSALEVLGWLTVVMDSRLLSDVISSPQGLDSTAYMMILRPANGSNMFSTGVRFDQPQDQTVIDNSLVDYLLPLPLKASDRHPDYTIGQPSPPFPLSSYPVAKTAVTKENGNINNGGASLTTTNEAGKKVSAGYSLVGVNFVDWIVVVEESRKEIWGPIYNLRKVILACFFATVGVLMLLVWPLAHFATKPIRQLRAATLQSVMPPGYADSTDALSDYDDHEVDGDGSDEHSTSRELARKEGFLAGVTRWPTRRKRKSAADRQEEARRRQFRIPGKVQEKKHLIKDELSDLTGTFNEMSDELMMQYERLEERVRQRTAELELSKKAAEAANESKTLFIANISHELKTPLNGILGMCAVCMQEDDPLRLKRSLGIIYKSGDLLLNLLTDLLTFSKNQVGQQLSLDEKDFRLRDISSQILAIFDKQANEGQIDLRVNFRGGDNDEKEDGTNPSRLGIGRVKDMVLWGDTHRILQVIINLVSNSLKFTPPGGSVTLTIKCLGETSDVGSRKTSTGSRATKRLSSRQRQSESSGTGVAKTSGLDGIADKNGVFSRITEIERATPPPGRTYMFEFEVVDTGPGIPEHLHQKIFEPFVQGDLGLSKKYGGTGLGLSICSQLAGLMRGSMGIHSEPGQGSTFTMTVPLRHLLSRADSTASSSVNLTDGGVFADGPPTPVIGQDVTVPSTQASPERQTEDHPRLIGLSQPFFASNQPMESPGSQPAAMEQITATAASSGRIRVLVAEDNKVNQEVVLRMLKLEDIYDVTVAKDGQEALDLVKESMAAEQDPEAARNGKGPFNLIFMDVQMPNLDGLQSTRLIREFGYRAPIVALTAFAEESNVKDCLESGMNYFLSKPIRRPALKKVLKEYCTPIMEVDEDAHTTPPAVPATIPEEQKESTALTQEGSIDGTIANPSHQRRSSIVDMAVAGSHQNTVVVVTSRPSSMEAGRSPRLSSDFPHSPTRRPRTEDGR